MSRLATIESFTGGDFEEYSERLGFYFLANDVGKLGPSPTQVEKQAADKKKAAVLISLLSGTVYSTLKSLCLPQSPGTKTFDELVALLEDYYKPEVSSVAATYLFNQCRQEHQEPVKDFVNRLKRAAVKCDFGAHNDRALRDQSTICREPPTHLRLLPVRHFVGIARFLSIPTCTFSVTKIGTVGSSCARSELVCDDG